MTSKISSGESYPLGATVLRGGVNFSVFSKNCTAMELLFFDDVDDGQPSRVIPLDPVKNRTFYYWHAFVRGVEAGQLYGYRAHGPFDPAWGHRFDGEKLLLDPYARGVAVGKNYSRGAAVFPGDNCAYAMKSVVVDNNAYDWEDDAPLHLSYSRTVIYELHVAGFTRHPSSELPENLRGTYAGLIEKIPYLTSLGITAVELLPVQQFDEHDSGSLINYWGYSPIGFFAPHSQYSSRRDPLGPVDEFRDMVKALHQAGIEVILDVVFNHTAEGNHDGPTISFRGLENRAYYMLEPNNTWYSNYSGCGNTFNGNQSIVRRLIIDCLHYWVTQMHVDGFRFDLASVLSRDEWGAPLKSPPILWEIESDPILASTKIIAEAWDAGGLYQVGTFIGHRWAEWNGVFRDDVRSFVKGEMGTVGRAAMRLVGSPDLYPQAGREPNRSINFITCHDGFTLNDLVSYNGKHNEANGEGNRDGNDNNISWNCGVEGPTDDPNLVALRLRQMKNFFTILVIAQGTPMIMMGDEVARTQYGNNNAYCQNNELSWFDWSLTEKNAGLLHFVQGLVHFTQKRAIFREETFWTNAGKEHHEPILTWHGTRLYQLDKGGTARCLAFSLYHRESGDYLHVIFNTYWEMLEFEIPPLPDGYAWTRIVDTALHAPDDFCDPLDGPQIEGTNYLVEGRASVILLAQEIR